MLEWPRYDVNWILSCFCGNPAGILRNISNFCSIWPQKHEKTTCWLLGHRDRREGAPKTLNIVSIHYEKVSQDSPLVVMSSNCPDSLLKDVRGVSIYEAGRIERESVRKPKVQQQYMEVEQPSIVDGKEVGLEDVGVLFGDG